MDDIFGDKGVLYNVHYPINPENVKEKGCDYVLPDIGKTTLLTPKPWKLPVK